MPHGKVRLRLFHDLLASKPGFRGECHWERELGVDPAAQRLINRL